MRPERKEAQVDEDVIVQWLTGDEKEDDKEEQNAGGGQEGNRLRDGKGAGQTLVGPEREQGP
jgi:hypothetical protein